MINLENFHDHNYENFVKYLIIKNNNFKALFSNINNYINMYFDQKYNNTDNKKSYTNKRLYI